MSSFHSRRKLIWINGLLFEITKTSEDDLRILLFPMMLLPALPGLNTRRFDLHPNWLGSGETVGFDSAHEGFRGKHGINLHDVMTR